MQHHLQYYLVRFRPTGFLASSFFFCYISIFFFPFSFVPAARRARFRLDEKVITSL